MDYGLIGEKLPHSFSKEIHEKITPGIRYDLVELSETELDLFMKKPNFKGINVTIPYKEKVIPYLAGVDSIARKIGAVNTIVNRNGQLYGFNTDYYGLAYLIRKYGMPISSSKVIILGTGGTSKTAAVLTGDMGAAQVIRVSRTGRDGAITYDELYEMHTDADIIINTTPCGMYPNIDATPVDISKFTNLKGVIDAIYNPLRSNLVCDARERGIKATGGLCMLVAQAAKSAEIFTGQTIDQRAIDKIYSQVWMSKANIILTGMPGCGKTTVGRIAAKRIQKEFLDVDRIIISKYRMNVSDIFALVEEKGFRRIEAEEIRELTDNVRGAIISTGGGAIINPDNVRNLKRTGIVVFIDRPLEDIKPTATRPLSRDTAALQNLYDQRIDKYKDAADMKLVPGHEVESTVRQFLGRIFSYFGMTQGRQPAGYQQNQRGYNNRGYGQQNQQYQRRYPNNQGYNNGYNQQGYNNGYNSGYNNRYNQQGYNNGYGQQGYQRNNGYQNNGYQQRQNTYGNRGYNQNQQYPRRQNGYNDRYDNNDGMYRGNRYNDNGYDNTPPRNNDYVTNAYRSVNSIPQQQDQAYGSQNRTDPYDGRDPGYDVDMQSPDTVPVTEDPGMHTGVTSEYGLKSPEQNEIRKPDENAVGEIHRYNEMNGADMPGDPSGWNGREERSRAPRRPDDDETISSSEIPGRKKSYFMTNPNMPVFEYGEFDFTKVLEKKSGEDKKPQDAFADDGVEDSDGYDLFPEDY